MTPRDFLNFFRTRTGALLLFLLLLFIGYFLVMGFKPPGPTPSQRGSAASEKTTRKPQIVETITRAMSAFHPPKETPPPSTPAPIAESRKESSLPSLPPISLYAESSTEKSPEPLGDDYAPYGRLVQCELVITVDSSTIDTPIVGLVTDDVWHNGRIIIPAGTEIHGTARVDHVRERIASNGSWTFVWQTGEELTVSGIALDREKGSDPGVKSVADNAEDSADTTWGITDGSAGLRGELLKSDDLSEIKLFAASFLSGAASGLTQTQQTIFGTQAVSSFQNAPLTGAQQVLNAYAQQILNTIERDGFYVRVPAGKQFYLYVTQTIDKSKAVIGGTRLATLKTPEEPPKQNPSDSLNRLHENLQRNYSPVTAGDGNEVQPQFRTTLPVIP
ncbi:MAG TPA: TrbI/VirB10 family protein [Verrucomicrobiae bacterium]|nr:TrbI/VirB10 family protein [Verrucomicrobiae bacterium]